MDMLDGQITAADLERVDDFRWLISVAQSGEIGWVVEAEDSAAIDRLRDMLRQLLPADFEIDESSEPFWWLEQAIAAACRHSGRLEHGRLRFALTEASLFGTMLVEVSLTHDLELVGDEIAVVREAANGEEIDRVVVRPADRYYDALFDLVDRVVEVLSDEDAHIGE
jgi:hypothetical protein